MPVQDLLPHSRSAAKETRWSNPKIKGVNSHGVHFDKWKRGGRGESTAGLSLRSPLWCIVSRYDFSHSMSRDNLHLSSYWLCHVLAYCDTAANIVMPALTFASVFPSLPSLHSCFLWLYFSMKHEYLLIPWLTVSSILPLYLYINILVFAKVCDLFFSSENLTDWMYKTKKDSDNFNTPFKFLSLICWPSFLINFDPPPLCFSFCSAWQILTYPSKPS